MPKITDEQLSRIRILLATDPADPWDLKWDEAVEQGTVTLADFRALLAAYDAATDNKREGV